MRTDGAMSIAISTVFIKVIRTSGIIIKIYFNHFRNQFFDLMLKEIFVIMNAQNIFCNIEKNTS